MRQRAAALLGDVARTACDVAAFLIPAIVYVASVSREPGSWDTAELQGVPYLLGIAHPTGFPFYVLLGYAWSHLIPFGSVAYRMNVMSALAVAGAAAAAYAVARELGVPRFVALGACLWFAFVHDIWQHAIRAEAIDVALLLCVLAVYAVVRWLKGGSNAWFAAAFGCYGLGLAAHPNALWIGFGLIAAALVARRRPAWRLCAVSAALVVAGLALYLYLPLRSAYIVAHGLDPTSVLPGAGGGLFWNYNDPHTFAGLRTELSGSQSGAPGYFLAAFDPVHYQDALWALLSQAGIQYGAFAFVIAAIGLVGLWKRDWRIALVLVLACSAELLFAVTYGDESDLARYRLLALWLVAPLLAAAVPRSDDVAGAAGRLAYGAFLAAGAALLILAGASSFDRSPGEGGRWVIQAVAPAVPRGSVIVAEWLDATSLAYGAYVDHTLAGRIILSGLHPEKLGYYRLWARRRRVFILADPTKGSLALPGLLRPYRTLDRYHQLLEIEPQTP